MCGGSCWHWMAFAGACWCLLVPDGVFLVSYGVWRWEEGVWGVTQRIYECCLWTWLRFGSLRGSIWVFRPCMMQQMLYIGKSPKGKIPHTWHFWNIKIPKPPYVSSLKIIGLLHLFKFLGPSKENYNLQSLWITLYFSLFAAFFLYSCYRQHFHFATPGNLWVHVAELPTKFLRGSLHLHNRWHWVSWCGWKT